MLAFATPCCARPRAAATRSGRPATAAAPDVLGRVNPQPGLILVDLMMPVMDGWQFLEPISDHRDLQRIPIVMVSAYRARDRPVSELRSTGGFLSSRSPSTCACSSS